MKNKKGLSGIVTTLIIILLVIAAVSVIWGVVSNLLESGTGSIQKGALCLEIDLRATEVVAGGTVGQYNVTIERKSGPDQDAQAYITFFSDVGNTVAIPTTNPFGILDIKTISISETETENFADANKVVITPYFIDEKSGKEIICDTTQKEFKFDI